MINSLVTIAIASYNNSLYISRCIESVINQSYHNLEILIIDDGSTDSTQEIIQPFRSDPRVIIINKDNAGLSSSRQVALETAQGEYICFIDADDYLVDSYVEDMLNGLVQSNANICVCGTRFEDEQGQYLAEYSKMFMCHACLEPYQPSIHDINQYNNSKVGELHISDSWNKMYEISYLRQCKVAFCMTKGLNGTDELFNRLLFIHRPTYITLPKELYIHVMYKKSAVHRKSRNLMASFTLIIEHMIDECENLGVLNDLKQYIINYYISSLYAAHLDILGDDENDFGKIKKLDNYIRNKYPFLTDTIQTDIPLNISLFYFLYKRYNRLVPFFFKIRAYVAKIRM